MKKHILGILLFSSIFFTGLAQESMDYFLPKDVVYNKDIPTPEEFFGQKIGDWHLNHEQILSYLHEIDRLSDRAIIQEYARSYENRPLVHMIFTLESNQGKLEGLKKLHNSFSENGSDLKSEDVPLVMILGYGIHGNESTASNSSVLTAYYLAAATGDKIDQLLSSAIILVDPCLNPDGFTRHSTWANMHQSYVPMGNPESRQFHEVWPAGRRNHYWFDLNRDYLPIVNPESRGRIAKFYEWKPNVITDHHEMGAGKTFFFQPGIPSRNNPLTPEKNYELTHKIASYHAKFLDKIGSAYYSEESFDDYYVGKGSTYPDVNGSIGILFEQASIRGRTRNTINGTNSFAFGIRNQFTVTLSTLEAAMDLKDELLDLQKENNIEAFELAGKDPVKAYVFGDNNDMVKTQMFIDLLNCHQIKVYENPKDITENGVIYKAKQSYIVPLKQTNYRFIKSFFDEATTFTDSSFYDVTTWTMPYAYDIPFAKVTAAKAIGQTGEEFHAKKIEGEIIGGESKLAYLFRWNSFFAPKALYALQEAGLITKVATKELCFNIDGGDERFTYGTVLIPVSGQKLDEGQVFSLVSNVAQSTGVDFYGMGTGLSPEGIDLGSGNFYVLKRPQVLMLIGGGTSSNDAGEIWHMFDQRYKIPICMVEAGDLRSVNLAQYTTLILPGGSYRDISVPNAQKIKSWVQGGGTLVAYGEASSWAANNGMGKTKFKKEAEKDTTFNFSYADRSKEHNINSISGIILNLEMDITHPLCYGYARKNIPVFKTGTLAAETLGIKYSEPVKFTSDPYLSGYVYEKNLERLKNAPAVSVQSAGRGNVISFYENITFRGFWLGTYKMFMNSIFFGDIIR